MRSRILVAVAGVLAVAACFLALRPLQATSMLHATWSCGSVLTPKAFAVPPFGATSQDFLHGLAAAQAACAEERDIAGARAFVLLFVAGSFAIASRKAPAEDVARQPAGVS